jgi:protein-disulfide isomerase
MTVRMGVAARGAGAVLLGLIVAACGQEESLAERTVQAAADIGREAAASPVRPNRDNPVGLDGSIDMDLLGYTKGDPNAPIRIVEFSDFGCGYCRKFHMETYPAVMEKYVETGVVQWQYIPYVLGIFPHGLEAALAGECAGEQGLLELYGARLFESQPEWKNQDGPVGDLFLQYAIEEGLDSARFEQCLVEDWRRDRVRANVIAGGQLGVRGTPTFYVPGYQPASGALPLEVFDQIIAYVLSKQEAAGQ